MKITIGKETEYCGNACLTKTMRGTYLVMSEFMLGDADDYKNNLMGSYKKVTKEMTNILIALTTQNGLTTEDISRMSEYLELPYSEMGYWSLQNTSVLYMDKDGNVFECGIEFDDNENLLIQSESISF